MKWIEEYRRLNGCRPILVGGHIVGWLDGSLILELRGIKGKWRTRQEENGEEEGKKRIKDEMEYGQE